MAIKERTADRSVAMPLTEHLRELRSRLVKSGIAIVIGMVVGWIYYDQIFAWLSAPFKDVMAQSKANGQEVTLALTGVADPFVLQLQVAAVTGLVLAGPIWLYQLWRFENVLRPNEVIHGQFDKCYVPRNAQTIGDLDIHELGIRKNGKVVFVNTKYSCLAELSQTHSFKAIWKPTFISKLAPEDRCHLNGLAMVDGEPKYVTAVCRSDSVDGWRDRRQDGGVVIDVQTDEIVCEGLSMPHSPRWHNGRLWVLNAGTGHLGWVDFEKKAFVPHASVPGFARGLSIIGNVAAVGLSKPRNQRFEGLQLDGELKKRDAEPWCGVQIISLANGDVLNWIRFEGDISEIFDIAFLPNVKNPMMIGLRTAEIRDLITFESDLPAAEASAA